MKIISICLLFFLSLSAQATILTFEGTGSVFSPISQDYGDRVSAEMDSTGHYQQGNGFTPNITTSYKSLDENLTTSNNYLLYWDSYGDLLDLAMPANFFGYGQITLTPDPSWGVTLNSFDMATWFSFEKDLSLGIYDQLNNELWTSNATTVGGPGHDSFYPNLSFTESINIRWGNSWDIGMDNINFDQYKIVSEPSSLILLLGLILLYLKRIKPKYLPTSYLAT